jgi:dTDP-4-dehydrorhamnose reductase
MKVVLLGASGQLGQEWQRVISKRSAGNVLLFPYTSSELDITRYRKVSKELHDKKPEVVVNCAAYTDVDGAEEDREKVRQVNTEAVSSLAKLSQELGFKLVHYSTDYIFPGNEKDRQNLPEGYPEDHPADPINWYGQTKWEGEQAIREAAANHLIIRLSWLCGQFGQNFVKTMLKLGRERDEVQVVNDQWGSPTFTKNVVINSLRLLESESKGTYHITSEGVITWYDLARAIFELNNIDVTVEPVLAEAFPTKAKRPRFSKLNTQKIESIGTSEIIHWKEGLRDMLTKLDS